MKERARLSLICAALAVAVAGSPAVFGQNANAASAKADKAATKADKAAEKAATKADKAAAEAEKKKLKPVRVKAPPRPNAGIKVNVAPGTWQVHKHKGNSPKFRPDREKDWVDPTGGKKPVRVKDE